MTVVRGNALSLPFRDESFRTCVTSPPYWGLRDYGVAGQFGLEATPAEYVANMVVVFREVRRVLRTDGTLWLNLGDKYAGAPPGNAPPDHSGDRELGTRGQQGSRAAMVGPRTALDPGVPAKNLIGIPWRVALALQDDGWVLRQEIIWAKPTAGLDQAVLDRPARSHEQIFLLSKSPAYYYDADAIREPLAPKTRTTFGNSVGKRGGGEHVASNNWAELVPVRKPRLNPDGTEAGANKRSVWTVASAPYAEAHFATFPPELIRPCIRAGAPRGGRVLDPFVGAGTTLRVCEEEGRLGFGAELNQTYCQLAAKRSIGAQVRML